MYVFSCGHHQPGFQQHDFTGCGDFVQNSPQAGKTVRQANKTSTPGQLTTSSRCFMVIWGNATIKKLLTAPSNLLYLFFLSTFEKIIPWGNAAELFFLPKKQQLQTATHSTTSSVAACGHQPPHLMMIVSSSQTDSAKSQLEQNIKKKHCHNSADEHKKQTNRRNYHDTSVDPVR